MKDISVILLTYNSSFDRILCSLKSIISQKNVDYELIISDDNSDEDHFELIKKFLDDNQVHDYRLIKNNKNLGIINNLLSASKLSNARYVKHLGQGDMFYDELSLFHIFDMMNNNDASAFFSDAVYYNIKEKNIKTYSVRSYPQLIGAYIKNNRYAIKRNYLVFDDNILGAAVSYNTEKLIKYLSMISNITKMYEDNILRLMAFYDENIIYSSKPTILYEYGLGLSTVNTDDNEKIYDEEFNAVNDLIIQLCENQSNKLYKQIIIHTKYDRVRKHSIIEKMNYYLQIPSFLFYRLLIENFPRKTKTMYGIDFIRKCTMHE